MSVQREDEEGRRNPAEENYAEVFQSTEDGQFYFAIRDKGNNEIVAQGEAYTEERGAEERVEALFPGIEIKKGRAKKIDNSAASAGPPPIPEEIEAVEVIPPEENPNFDEDGEPIYGEPSVEPGAPEE